MIRIFVHTTGCSINRAIGEIIEGKILEKYELVKDPKRADIIILNLCIIKKPTEDRAIELTKKYHSLNKKIIVTGCLAEGNPQRVKKILPSVSIINPSFLLGNLEKIIENVNDGQKITIYGKPIEIRYPSKRNLSNKYIGIVPIALGCTNNCSFCIDKKIFGVVKSIPKEKILEEIKKLLRDGAKEIRLTAHDTAAYGIDKKTNLVELLEEILKIDGEFRIRIGMASPNTYAKIMDSLLEIIKNDDRVYKFIHIPVQSGSDRILKLMNRPYTISEYKDIFFKTRKILGEDSTIATDIISAFPTETEDDHKATVDLLKEIKPDIVNLSRYGDRPGRPASKIYPKVHSKVAKRRTRELFMLIQKISYERNLALINKKMNTLFLDFKKNHYLGRAYNNKIVFTKDNIELGEFYYIKIKKVTWKSLYGDLT